MNKWIWFVMTIFGLLSIAHSSCDDICGLDRIVVDDDNLEEKLVNKFRKGQGHKINCFDTTKVTVMSYLFHNDYNGEIFKDFNEDISCWDTSSVTNMRAMFYKASSFNRDISSWDTSGVTDMNNMFYGASLFGKSLCNWNVNQVTYSTLMFTNSRCTKTSCLDCTPISVTSSPSVSAPTNPSSTTTRLDPTSQEDYEGTFTKTNSSAYMPSSSPIVVSNCKKEYVYGDGFYYYFAILLLSSLFLSFF